ncbi:hypothetical protein EC968_002368 [Mortierella alpina]|nr:hypothetical protein EC968_002368 [Mortierella alpina]
MQNDTVAISVLLHRHGAYAFFDYAGVGPYTAIDMNPAPSSNAHHGEPNLAYKDGVFLSTHKFLGGPGSSGVLIARVEIFSWADRNGVHLHNSMGHVYSSPTNPGGGTVDMVIHGKHKYSSSVIAREEAGTPNILATIRTGLVFKLQEIVDPAWILEQEYRLAKLVMARLTAPGLAKAIHVLGASPEEQDRIAVFSLTMAVPFFVTPGKITQQQQPPPRSPSPQDQGAVEQANNDPPLQIHYALLSTIMNDFFGIEMRGGCMCAGPYASKLLQFDAVKEAKFWRLLMGETETRHGSKDDNEGRDLEGGAHPPPQQRDLCAKSLKPGFVRFSFSYFTRDKDVEFVLQSLEWVARYGYLLVPLYTLDANSGSWSTREAVREAVYAEISPIQAKCGSRTQCIPTAIECIYALKKLFQVQQVLLSRSSDVNTVPALPPIGQEIFLRAQESSSSSNHNDSCSNINSNGIHGARVFASVAQARRSLSNVISDVFNRPSTSKISGAHSLSIGPPRMRSDAMSMTMRDDHERTVLGDSSLFPSSSEYSSMNSGFSTAAPAVADAVAATRQVHDPKQGTTGDASSLSSSSSSSSSLSLSSAHGGRNPIAAKRITQRKKLGLFSVERRSLSTQKGQVLKQALEELGTDTLQREVEEVENSPLAKELRWFVMPWEVAQVYRRHLMHSTEVSSPFPNRV